MRWLARIATCLFLTCPGAGPRLEADQPAASRDKNASADTFVVWTIDGAQLTGKVEAVSEDRLRLGGETPQEIPLDEIERAVCGPPPATSVEWLGQDQHDFVRVGGAKEPNGIQDVHLRLRNLPLDRTLQQVQIVVRYAEGTTHKFRAWRMDTTRTTHWKIAVVAQTRTTPGIAQLYLEPDSVDAFGQKFDLTLTYDDGSQAKLSVLGATHTDDQLAVREQRTEPAAGEAALPLAQLHLSDRSSLRVRLREVTADSVLVSTAWGDQLQVPIVRALGLQLLPGPSAEGLDRFRSALSAPGPQDQALLTTRDNKITPIRGTLEALGTAELQWQYEGESRKVKLDRLVGVVFARHPGETAPAGLQQTFHFRNGDRLRARWKSLDGERCGVELSWGNSVSLPLAELHAIDFHGGRLTYLSDLEPAAVEEVPYFGRVMQMRRDTTFTGAPLKLAETEYRKGLAMHSRCAVTYALDGQYDLFRAVLGFDPSGREMGDVECRVLLDGKRLFERAPYRGGDPPVPVEISVRDGEQLTLEVDFGAFEDIGDRLLWADAKLIRASDPQP